MKVINSLSDVNFSIEDAALAGYKIKMDGDGCAEILKADGTAYHIHVFACDCPDSQNRQGGSYERPNGERFCKHTALLLQFRPCPMCSSVMMQIGSYFECIGSGCGWATDARIVKQERQQAQQEAASAA